MAVSYTHLDVYKRQDMLIPPQQKAISSDNKKLAGKWALSKADCETNNSFILTNDGKYLRDEEEGNWSLNGNDFTFSTVNEEMINDKPTMKKRVVKMTLQKITSENVVLQRTDAVSYTHLDVYKRQPFPNPLLLAP